MIKELVIATYNPGKLKEITLLFSPIHCIGQSTLNIPSPDETQWSFVENALLKARHVSIASQKAALADDSGLVVPALQGSPGIFSARYAGDNASDKENIARLLTDLTTIPKHQWQAYFYCAVVLLKHPHDPTPLIGLGRLDGMITDNPRGCHGFGYDPIFYLPKQRCTLAEMSIEEKNTISHRQRAIKQLKQQLVAYESR